jgi:ELWxxDGT repeat protein
VAQRRHVRRNVPGQGHPAGVGVARVADARQHRAVSSLLDVGGTLFFVTDDGAHGLEIWRSDGTAGGTSLVRDVYTGAEAYNPYGLTRS